LAVLLCDSARRAREHDQLVKLQSSRLDGFVIATLKYA
jgi:hypothetical protein